jgi:predicted CXXCH cytochrome family protein
VNAICAQCHCAVVAEFENGAGCWNSREAVDLARGACAGAIKCTDCHDPHRATGAEAQPDAARAAACVRCHAALADPGRARGHSRHAPAVSCLDCHMPRISQGLEEVVRSHTISKPTDPRMLAPGSPNACNLCHLDESLRWTADALAAGWGKSIDARGDAAVGGEWLASEDHFLRLVATQAYARSPLGRAALPAVAAALEDRVPVNRVFAQIAVERILGEPLGERYDVMAPQEELHRQVEALRVSWR